MESLGRSKLEGTEKLKRQKKEAATQSAKTTTYRVQVSNEGVAFFFGGGILWHHGIPTRGMVPTLQRR